MGWVSDVISQASGGASDVSNALGLNQAASAAGDAANAVSGAATSLYQGATTGAGGVAGAAAAPLTTFGMVGLYNSINGLINPPKPSLQNPASIAPADPNATAQSALSQTVKQEVQQSSVSSYLPMSEGLDSAPPNTTSRVLLGS